ncbi:Mitochondrial 39-S ribosomal protein L47 (MRP-L47) [Phytophthora infestans]|nr:Mitochondrial 39-S ribosomal protein L47 (MRP-L47) [Phytophthora infestans]
MDPILDKILEEQKTQRTERNALLTELQQCRVKNLTMPNPSRRTKVKKSMARIKLVLHERSDIYKSNQAKKAAEQ